MHLIYLNTPCTAVELIWGLYFKEEMLLYQQKKQAGFAVPHSRSTIGFSLGWGRVSTHRFFPHVVGGWIDCQKIVHSATDRWSYQTDRRAFIIGQVV